MSSFNKQIAHLNEKTKQLNYLTRTEQEKIFKKWVLFQRLIKLDRIKKNTYEEVGESIKINNLKIPTSDTIVEDNNGQLVFRF